jgi:YHS domain-containing protein
MSDITKFAKRTVFTVGVSLIFLLAIQGCKKQEPTAQQPPKSTSMDKAAMAANDTAEDAVEQTTCPVMEGNPIDKTLFVEYKGKKVYFCCKECEGKFLADPEKYVAKLPQFKK